MMISIEQVERLREKTGVSYQDAREALEKTEGDMLDAVILLEREGKLHAPEGGGRARVEPEPKTYEEPAPKAKKPDGRTFGEMIDKFIAFCGRVIHAGSVNSFVVTKRGSKALEVPVLLLALFLIIPFTSIFVIAALIIGLFCDYRYSFRGPNLGRQNVNDAMGTVADKVGEIKKSVKDSQGKE
jgi:hypothetical protein